MYHVLCLHNWSNLNVGLDIRSCWIYLLVPEASSIVNKYLLNWFSFWFRLSTQFNRSFWIFINFIFYNPKPFYFKDVGLRCVKKKKKEKKRKQDHRPKLSLNYRLDSPRNIILNQSLRNHLISTSEIICLIDPCQLLKESDLTVTNPPTFLPSITSLFLLLPVYSTLSFCTAP